MGLLDLLRRKTAKSVSASHDDWPSIVFLLKAPQPLTAEAALQMGKDAWGAGHEVTLAGAVKQHSFVLQAGNLHFALHSQNRRYEISGKQIAPVRQQCWDEHAAWMSIDMPGKRTLDLKERGDLGGAYQVLMYFVNKHWSANCLGLYFPAEGVTIPNLGDLIQSIRWTRMNGTNLEFLKTSQSPARNSSHQKSPQ